jgi:hypothetical protein
MIRLATLLALVALLTACQTLSGPPPQPKPIPASGLYVHAASRFSFPETFGDFRRVDINQYDDDGLDVGVGYDRELAGGQIALTLYVMPHRTDEHGKVLSLAQRFEIERRNIVAHHEKVTLTHPWTPPQTVNGEPTRGYAAAFRYAETFETHRQELESLLYLFELDQWVVKYRIIYPVAQRLNANQLAQQFVANFRWRSGGSREGSR